MTTPPGSVPVTTTRSYLLRNTILAMSTDRGWGFALALVAATSLALVAPSWLFWLVFALA